MTTAISARLSAAIIGLLFIVPGLIKTVDINKALQKHMLAQFRNFSTVFPLAPLGVVPAPRFYMELTGVLEVAGGVLLLAGVPLARRAACLLLMALMMGATFSHLRLGDTSSLVVPAGYFGLLCWTFTCLRKVDEQVADGGARGYANQDNGQLYDQYKRCAPSSEQHALEEEAELDELEPEQDLLETTEPLPRPTVSRSTLRPRRATRNGNRVSSN